MRRGRNDQQEETWRFSYYPPCRYFLKIAVQHFASLPDAAGRVGGAFPLFCAFLIWPLLQQLQSHVHCVFVNISRMSHHPATQAHVTGIQLHSASLLPLFLLLRLTLSLPFPPLSFILSAFSPWFPAPHWILGEPSHRLLLFLCFSPTPRLLASTTSPRLLSWPCFGSD